MPGQGHPTAGAAGLGKSLPGNHARTPPPPLRRSLANTAAVSLPISAARITWDTESGFSHAGLAGGGGIEESSSGTIGSCLLCNIAVFGWLGERSWFMHLTAIIEREDEDFVALCPEVDVASQGGTIEEARDNLREALTLFFESASPEEKQERVHGEVFVTSLDLAVG